MKNKGYLNKCKRRDVCFYIKDMEIYEKSKAINFQKFVKLCLKYIDECARAIACAQREEKQKERDKK